MLRGQLSPRRSAPPNLLTLLRLTSKYLQTLLKDPDPDSLIAAYMSGLEPKLEHLYYFPDIPIEEEKHVLALNALMKHLSKKGLLPSAPEYQLMRRLSKALANAKDSKEYDDENDRGR